MYLKSKYDSFHTITESDKSEGEALIEAVLELIEKENASNTTTDK
jgi:hypothetical protein